ncbi:hypothetical protein GCM10010129_79980 [Streptomyces fumigatiscleroticus]|nr:hypothetical protein GCM10010129_79980 [Streptomyces fumigatiscleroticus]
MRRQGLGSVVEGVAEVDCLVRRGHGGEGSGTLHLPVAVAWDLVPAAAERAGAKSFTVSSVQ